MPELRVTLIDEVRNRRLKVDLPDDAAMEKLLPALAEKLGLPVTDPGGQPIAYRLTDEATGRALGGDQTLASFGVRVGEALRLTAAREKAPIVPGPAVELVDFTEEEAVSLWQKVPVWGWAAIGGVVLLIAVVGAYLAGRGAKPEPAPMVVAKATTPTVTEAPTRPALAPTATPAPPTAVPTSTPLPTDTPVPTNTPRPTATPVPPTATPTRPPWPTPTPTATIDADLTVYDNFNNPANDGSFNQSQWEDWSDPPNQVLQQDGILIVTQASDGDTRLAARKHTGFKLDAPTFFEARLMLDPDRFAGNVQLHLHADLPGGKDWWSECRISDYGGAKCADTAWPEQEGHGYGVESRPVDLGTWHTFRIEVDPATMTFTYYIDGEMVGSHVPVDAEELKKARFTLSIGVWGPSSEALTGYIDDVRVGPVQ